jgi:hypothetical protein
MRSERVQLLPRSDDDVLVWSRDDGGEVVGTCIRPVSKISISLSSMVGLVAMEL